MNPTKWIVFTIVVVVLLAGIATVVKMLVIPHVNEQAAVEAAEQEKLEQEELLKRTSDGRTCEHAMKFALDDFSSYFLLRMDSFQNALVNESICLKLEDDGADYRSRLAKLKSGELDMAVFTIDQLLIHSQEFGFPAVIVALYDKSNGADGAVTFQKAVSTIEALNVPGARIIAMADAPPETLGHNMVANMLPAIRGETWLSSTKSQEETLARMRAADPNLIQAFIFYEPYLSMALEITGTTKIYDSSMVSGTIMDVLVVRRVFLDKHPDLVQKILETYLTELARLSQEPGALVAQIKADAVRNNHPITDAQAKKIADGILWVNTLENYAMFGLLPANETQGLPHIRSMIDQIARFLVKTGKLKEHPVANNPEMLYSSLVLKRMQARHFRPMQDEEQIRGRKTLKKLSDEEWSKLTYRFDMDAAIISFRPGSTNLEGRAIRILSEVAEQLENWPYFYVEVQGQVSPGGNIEANKALAASRVQTVINMLTTKGVNSNRLRGVTSTKPHSSQGRSVVFRLYQQPY